MASWLSITQIFITYIAPLIFLLSLFGCLMNTILFSTVYMYRSQPCTFFLLIAAISRFVHLLNTGLSRGLAIMIGKDVTLVSPVLCKTRSYLINVCLGISMTCECLATVDRFLVTSRNANFRRMSNIKLAYRITVVLLAFWLIENVPCFLFIDIISANICAIHTNFWMIYSKYVINWVSLTIVPLIICISFGLLAYRNMHSLKNSRQLQGSDRQLSYMILAQVIITIIPIIPSAFFFTYSSSAISINEAAEKGVEYFVFNFINTLTGFFFGVSR
ncbi:unnamed protein product [Adineta ricciae]|uniref:G-protein coupled receptors family 1 profile domain-containing protein n=1 Tax=Adineta ricciae TaxID=249248 RepID=A0A815HRM4_ADIRI|nr:unnamed protein product [Adineta ricciae]CAF1623973.1 unnamed protein product [Adineta ricciae]